jgi:hypothetical protein
MAAATVHISIAVFKGDPVDSQRYRHTSLFVTFANHDPSTVFHVVGPPGEFEYDIQIGYDPSGDQSLAKLVDVGPLSVESTRNQIIQILRRVPIENEDREFNCQTWVEGALKKLRELGMLTGALYAQGLDEMVDVIAEATDEEY